MESFEAAVEPSPSHSERLGHGDLRKLGFYEETGVYGTASIKFHPKVTELSQLPHVWAGEVAGWRSQEREREISFRRVCPSSGHTGVPWQSIACVVCFLFVDVVF